MQAPKISSMFGFKTKKPNQFYFEPRYYDAGKEKMQKRYDRIGKEVAPEKTSSQKSSTVDFRSELRDSWGTGRSKTGNQVNRRVIFYVMALVGLAYFILYF